MAAADFARSMPHILVYEGGKVNDPRDPGGRTNQGITQNTFNVWLRTNGNPVRDVYTLTDGERDAIYKAYYWDRGHCDDMPIGFDFCFFDAAVNSGVGQATKWLQQSLVPGYTGTADGDYGPKTRDALLAVTDPETLIEDFCQRRLGTLERLSTWKTFGKGWEARISNVDKVAKSWAASVDAPDPVDVTDGGGGHKATVDNNIIKPPVSPIVTHVVAGAGSVGAAASQTAQQIQPLSDTFGWIKYVFGALTLVGVVAGIFLTFGKQASDAAIAGTAKKPINPDADLKFPSVKVPKPALIKG